LAVIASRVSLDHVFGLPEFCRLADERLNACRLPAMIWR
jgi:hypothetical protein